MRKVHTEAFHKEAMEKVTSSRSQPWSQEEIKIMAHYEAEHLTTKFLNQAIQRDLFPGRSTNSINGKRRSQPYKALVNQFENQIGVPPRTGPSLGPTAKTETTNIKDIPKLPKRTKKTLTASRKSAEPSNDVAPARGEGPARPTINDQTKKLRPRKPPVSSLMSAGSSDAAAQAEADGPAASRRMIAGSSDVAAPKGAAVQPEATTKPHINSSPRLDSDLKLPEPLTDRDKPMKIKHNIRQCRVLVEKISRTRLRQAPNRATTPSPPPDSPPDPDSPSSPSSSSSVGDLDEDLESTLDRMQKHLTRNLILRPPRANNPPRRPLPNLRPAVRRRRRFAVSQKRWLKDRGSLVRDVLAGKDLLAAPKTPEGTQQFWCELFSRLSPPCQLENFLGGDINVIEPVTREEIDWLFRTTKLKSAPGPDGVTPREFLKIDKDELREFYSFSLQKKTTTVELQTGRTILIPKVDNPEDPGDYRPITITSVITRGLHKIIAKRIMERLPTEQRQKGFKQEEGTASNIMLLRAMIEEAKDKPSPIYMAFVDFRKAFDSISHEALLRAVKFAGLSQESAEYLNNVYRKIQTQVLGRTVKITRGVMQGDPMSPSLFNLTLQYALQSLLPDIGVPWGQELIKYLAFADDIVLVATSRPGLQLQINALLQKAGMLGLEAGFRKCATVGIMVNPRKGTWICDRRPFDFQGVQLPSVSPDGFYKYLGAEVGAAVRSTADRIITTLHYQLEQLRNSCLKPQQKLWALRICAIPKIRHKATNSNLRAYQLKKIDLMVRKFVRAILHLPKDAPTGVFYATINEGGLGLICFSTQTPKDIYHQSLRLSKSNDVAIAGVASKELQSRPRPELAPKIWEGRLHQSVDGCGLSEAHLSPDTSRWVGSGTRLMRGGTFVNAVKLRSNLLWTPSRASRGREVSSRCDLGCDAAGTLHHILQVCPRVQPWRIKRHDRVLELLDQRLKNRGYTTLKEPRITTPAGTRIPDLIAWDNERSFLLDVQVTSDSNVAPLADLHKMKVTKYKTKEIESFVAAKTGYIPETTSATWNWRGVMARPSILALKKMGLTGDDLGILGVRVIEGGLTIYANYMGTSGGGDVG